jgi:cytochrome c oxidase cbb3-type subunit III
MLAKVRILRLIAVVCVLWGNVPKGQSQTEHAESPGESGKALFARSCAACHGLDGRGSERAPNIADSATIRSYSDSQIFDIVQNGIEETGMPAFHALSKSQIDAIVAHLRTLKGTSSTAEITGDPAAGKKIFFGEAGCSRCHMVAGSGGFIASDLSEYANGHRPEEIQKAIKDSASLDHRGLKLVTITLHNGRKFSGRLRNEDNFSVQLQAVDGSFQLLARSAIQSIEANPQLQMPDYSSLRQIDINNLLSYLREVSQASKTDTRERAKRAPDDDNDE